MKRHLFFMVLITGYLILNLACSVQEEAPQTLTVKARTQEHSIRNPEQAETIKPLITFIELGSVNCVPCRMMQPIMKAVEEKYGAQIAVIFYDVWKPEQRHYAQVYGIRVIPTQVFLDSDGNEISRHEGFFPEAELDSFLQENGLTPIAKG